METLDFGYREHVRRRRKIIFGSKGEDHRKGSCRTVYVGQQSPFDGHIVHLHFSEKTLKKD